MLYGHNSMATTAWLQLMPQVYPGPTVRKQSDYSWTVARSVTTPADQHKTQVNRFFFFFLDHTSKIHFSQACLHGKKYRIGKLYLLLCIITILQTNYIANSAGVATHMGFFRKF